MPFMDWRLVTYVMSLPDSAKLTAAGSKAIARQAMAGRMPDAIVRSQRKVGFNSPMPDWLNGSLGSWAAELLSSPDPAFDAIVRREALRKRVMELTSRGKWTWETAGRLWPYINLKWLMEQKVLA